MKRTDHAGLQSLVAEMFGRYPIARLCVDSGGLGTFPTEELQKRFGVQAVEPVNFGAGNQKELLATTLSSSFLDGWVRIPADDGVLVDITDGSAKGLVDDVCSLRRIITASGNVRYDAPRNLQGHADRAWALALALYAITHRPSPREISFQGQRDNGIE
jgi:phage FluMu gp28-like protein